MELARLWARIEARRSLRPLLVLTLRRCAAGVRRE